MIVSLLLVLLAFVAAVVLSWLLYAKRWIHQLALGCRTGYLRLGRRIGGEKSKPSGGTSFLEIFLHAVAFWLLWSWPATFPSEHQLAAPFVALFLFLVIQWVWPSKNVSGRETAVVGLLGSMAAVALLGSLAAGRVSWSWVRFPVIVAVILLVMRAVGDRCFAWKNVYENTAFGQAEVRQVGQKVCVKPTRPPEVPWSDLLRSLLLVLVESPILMFVFPSLVAVLAPSAPEWWAAIGLAVTFVLVGSMHVHRDLFEDIRFLLERMLTQGLAQFVSWGVVLMAGLRLADSPYVTYILDESPGNAVAMSIATAYAVCWLHDHWERRAHAEALVERIGCAKVEPHGDGCLLLRCGDVERSLVPWQFFGELEKVAKDETPLGKAKYRMQLRFLVSKLLVVAVAAVAGWTLYGSEPRPAIEIHPGNAAAEPSFSLSKSILEATGETEPLLLIAASGGGTRAALYTTSVLRAIDQRRMLSRVVLLSGVSGGSLAIAGLAQSGLLRKEPLSASASSREYEWSRLFALAGRPYIGEVFGHLDDPRFLMGKRLSHLLQESFDRHLRHLREGTSDNHSQGALELSQASHVGLIFNTSLCGINWSRAQAGGRLVLTNVEELGSGRLRGVEMPYYAFGGGVSLSRAAALSANFPFVFGNSLVRVGGQSFYVTDGGAVDNRGLLSLLVALRETLKGLDLKGKKPVPIHLLVAEASALPNDYANDRGLGLVMGASAQVANLAIQELLQECRQLYGSTVSDEKGEELIRLFEIPMPDVFRVRGALGTHWKLPKEVTVGEDKLTEDQIVTRIRHLLDESPILDQAILP